MSIPEILETFMLICFGFSWPISVIKNIKAKTSKSMSLPFILLILSGYVAGIIGKIINGSISYVLIVYVFNLVSVTLNLIIYFVNLRHDRSVENTRDNVELQEDETK